MRSVLATAIAIAVGLIVLLSYFFEGGALLALRLVLVDWAITLAGLAVLVGILNLILVHIRRVDGFLKGWPYSLLTVLAALFTIVLGIIEATLSSSAILYGQGSYTHLAFQGIVVASQAAIASLILFALVAAAVRMFRTQPNGWTGLFLAALLVVLIGWLPFREMLPVAAFREWVLAVPVTAGARGILIGVALGTVVIGLRILTGQERPFKT